MHLSINTVSFKNLSKSLKQAFLTDLKMYNFKQADNISVLPIASRD